jgi:hypothetical protein
MKNHTNHTKTSLAFWATLLVSVLAASSASAVLVVDLGFAVGASPDQAPLRTVDTNTSSAYTWNWDAGNLFYDNPIDGRSQEIYAGISYTTYGGTATLGGSTGAFTAIVDGGPAGSDAGVDRIRAQVSGTAGGSGDSGSQVNLLYLWNSANFLQSAASWSFDATANSSLSSSLFNVQLPTQSASHFVIRDGTTYYLSSASAGLAAGDSTTIFGNTGGLQWATFNPDLFASFNGDAGNITTGAFSSQTFNDVTGVGIIAFTSRANNSGALFDINGFQANLVGVPEPSAFALLSGFAALALILIRRRRVS